MCTWAINSVCVIERISSTNIKASTHMSVCLSPGDSQYLGASCHPPVGVQIQGWDGSHPSESGRPPDNHGGQRTQLPEHRRRHPNGSNLLLLAVFVFLSRCFFSFSFVKHENIYGIFLASKQSGSPTKDLIIQNVISKFILRSLKMEISSSSCKSVA